MYIRLRCTNLKKDLVIPVFSTCTSFGQLVDNHLRIFYKYSSCQRLNRRHSSRINAYQANLPCLITTNIKVFGG
jgi:hypothetical protein